MDTKGLAASRREAAHEADFEGVAGCDGVVLLVAVKVNLCQTCDCRHWRHSLRAGKRHACLLMHLCLVKGMLGRLVELVRWS